jgi:UPF0176 protein
MVDGKHQRLKTNDQRPKSNDQRPKTNDQRPTTNDQRPKTNDQRPTTKHNPRIQKTLLGKGVHFFPKASIGQFLIENDELNIGDTLLIKGPTTGEQAITVFEMFVNDTVATKAVKGDHVSLKLDFRIRLSDKLYKLEA